MTFKKHNLRIILVVIALYICNKFFIVPNVLAHGIPESFKIFVGSFPNLFEAIVGSLFLTNVALFRNKTLLGINQKLPVFFVFLITVIFTGVFVFIARV